MFHIFIFIWWKYTLYFYWLPAIKYTKLLTLCWRYGKIAYMSMVFFKNSSTNVILVSGVQHSDLIFIYVTREMCTAISLVTICHCLKLLQYYWLYSLSCTLYPYDLCTWKFVPLNPLHHFSLPRIPCSLAVTHFSSLYL